MFGLFNKKVYQPTVTLDDKVWIEQNIIWFIEVFGLDKLKEQPFILPTTENFPYSNLKENNQFQKLFEKLCKYWDINPNEIIVKFFDDFKSKQWTTWIPHGEFNEAGAFFEKINTTDEKRFNIQIAKSNLDNPQLLVSVIAHELAHVKLLGGNYINNNDADLEPLTDLASIFFGFGIFVANSVQTQDIYWISRTGYLPNQLISYANALICYILAQDEAKYVYYLNGNTIDLFKKDINFLRNTNDTLLTQEKVSESEYIHKMNKMINDEFENRNFEEAINCCEKLLKTNPKNIDAINNIGYAMLQQKKYHDAIEQFTKAIEIDPYWEYPYSYRGYCKLQLKDIENSYLDILHSYELNPDNPYMMRNLGAYYLESKEFEKALYHFEEAKKTDPKTELINFYLGQALLKLGKLDESIHYLNISIQLNEYNDTTIV